MSVWPEPTPKGFLAGVGSHGGPFGVRPLHASCLRVEREESQRGPGRDAGGAQRSVPSGMRAAPSSPVVVRSRISEGHVPSGIKHCTKGGALETGIWTCGLKTVRNDLGSRRDHLRVGLAAGRSRGTFGCSGCGGVGGSSELPASRRIPFGEHPAAGSRFGLRAAPTDQRPSGTERCWRQGSAAVFGLRAEPVGGLRLRATGQGGDSIGPRSQTKPRNFAFPGLSAPGNAPRVFGPAVRAGGDLTPPTQYAWQAGTCSIQSPWEHRLERGGNAATRERTPRWSKALRSGSGSTWRHGGWDQTTRGQCFPVNAGDRGDGRLLPGRGTLRRVNACENGFQNRAPPGWRAGESSDSRKPETRRTPRSAAGCNKPARCQGTRSSDLVSLRSKPSEPGGTARTERVWDLAVPGRRVSDGSSWSGRSGGHVGEGEESMNPMRGVPSLGAVFGPSPADGTARTGVCL